MNQLAEPRDGPVPTQLRALPAAHGRSVGVSEEFNGLRGHNRSMTMNDDDFAELLRQLSSGSSPSPTWGDVRAEFEALTHTLGEIIQAAFNFDEQQPLLARLHKLITSATQDLDATLDGSSPEARQVHDQLVRLREALRSAVISAGDELRPELLKLLREVNGELRRRSGIDSAPR
jgi:hypothetical protein